MDPANIWRDLNPQQRRAVETVRGPLCVLAGAGSGKTTTITRRIANQVASGAFEASQILPVTFTEKAAGEMRSRLAALGVEGVRARTFHAAALGQLRFLAPEPPGTVLPSKAVVLRQIANALPRPYRFRPAGDLANEIERAKNRRVTPDRYVDSLNGHEPPIPPDLMQRVWHRYERGKRERNLIDFEDLLEHAICMFEDDADALDRFQARYLAFTVDEYQDVNLLQHTLLQRWLGDRDDVCAVGDDYQSIYAFTGASPGWLLDMPRSYERIEVVRLETNYRSTTQVLDLANRLAPALGGTPKTLRASIGAGPAHVARPYASPDEETRAIAARIGSLHRDAAVPYEDMAVLYRVNFRSEDFEETLAHARIPFQVRGGDFLSRAAARRLLNRLRPGRATDVADRVRSLAEGDGLLPAVPDGLGEQEATRQNDLGRLVSLAAEFDDGVRSVGDFIDDLRERFTSEGNGRGVNLLTYHRAKGLEFEAVFLPRLQEGELPFKRSKSDEALAEERRLLYVGITRAKRYLWLSWVTGSGQPSRFLSELGLGSPPRPVPSELYSQLKRWRLERARADEVPAYVVFNDATLEAIAGSRPQTRGELAAVSGIGPSKLERYGPEVLALLAAERGPGPGE